MHGVPSFQRGAILHGVSIIWKQDRSGSGRVPNVQYIASECAVLVFYHLKHVLLTAAEPVSFSVSSSPVPIGFSAGEQQLVGGRVRHPATETWHGLAGLTVGATMRRRR